MYKVKDLSKLKDYGFEKHGECTYSLKLDYEYDSELGNEFALNLLVNPHCSDDEEDTLVINHFADVSTFKWPDESGGCDKTVDITKMFETVHKMLIDGVIYKVEK